MPTPPATPPLSIQAPDPLPTEYALLQETHHSDSVEALKPARSVVLKLENVFSRQSQSRGRTLTNAPSIERV